MVWITQCLSHNVQYKTKKTFKFLGKFKIWNFNFCCTWGRTCFFNGFCCVLFSIPVCPLFIFIVISYWLIWGNIGFFMFPDKQFFYFVSFIIYCKTLIYKFPWFSNGLMHHTAKTLKNHLYVNNQFFNDNCDIL